MAGSNAAESLRSLCSVVAIFKRMHSINLELMPSLHFATTRLSAGVTLHILTASRLNALKGQRAERREGGPHRGPTEPIDWPRYTSAVHRPSASIVPNFGGSIIRSIHHLIASLIVYPARVHLSTSLYLVHFVVAYKKAKMTVRPSRIVSLKPLLRLRNSPIT